MARIVLVAGIAVLMVVAALWWRARPAPDVGAATVSALAAAPSSSPGSATSVGAAPRAVPVQDGSLPTATRTVAPVEIRLPGLGVRAPVIPVGVDADEQVVIPEDVRTVGWYRFGPGVDAAAGSVVLVGHVDSANQGPGAFFRLREARQGSLVEVSGSDGRTVRYQVVARETVDKERIDLRRYFSATGAPRLTLVTCGGTFDSTTGHYRDNVVVTAVPADGPA